MPALGGWKPSELMAAMLETCPRGEEKTNLFACIFLQRLPREIRVLLAKADQKDTKTLRHRRTSCGLFMTTTVAAAAWRLYRRIQRRIMWPPFPETSRGVAVPPAARLAAAAAAGPGKMTPRLPEPEASKEARLAAGLCIKHWRYGEAPSSCEQPCSWQGNGGAGGN
jgi:hypothetical protein